jgi:hypothetical protein
MLYPNLGHAGGNGQLPEGEEGLYLVHIMKQPFDGSTHTSTHMAKERAVHPQPLHSEAHAMPGKEEKDGVLWAQSRQVLVYGIAATLIGDVAGIKA